MISRFMTFLGRTGYFGCFAALAALAGWIVWNSLQPPLTAAKIAAAPRHPDLLLMDAVRRVSADASLLMLSPVTGFGMDEPAACTLARRVVGDKDFPAGVLKKWDDECAFGVAVGKASNPVFRAIAQSGALPPAAFVFDASVGLKEEWHTLGLFADSDTCARMVAAAVALRIGVRSCLPWTPRF